MARRYCRFVKCDYLCFGISQCENTEKRERPTAKPGRGSGMQFLLYIIIIRCGSAPFLSTFAGKQWREKPLKAVGSVGMRKGRDNGFKLF